MSSSESKMDIIASGEVQDRNGQSVLVLTVQKQQQQAVVEIYLHGATVTKWEETGSPPFLFLSEKAILDGSKPIRGGIPIIFPQFSSLGSLTSHGFARTSQWKIDSIQSNHQQEYVEAILSLHSNQHTQQIWNHDFELKYKIRLVSCVNSRLFISWTIINLSESKVMPYHTALHTYFNVGDITQVQLQTHPSLQQTFAGLSYADNTDERKIKQEENKIIIFDKEVDRIYLNTPDHFIINDAHYHRNIHIVKQGYPDAIVWNAWKDRTATIADLNKTDYQKYVCVEVGHVLSSSLSLAPLSQAESTMELYVEQHQ